MLAGEQGTGKTTIARYLVGKGPTTRRLSTDGIDLYNGLSFIDREAKEWMHGKQDFTLSEVAISRSLPQSRDTLTKHKGKGQSSSKDEVVPDGQAQRLLTSESRDTLTKHKGKGQSSFKDEVVPDGQAQRLLTSESRDTLTKHKGKGQSSSQDEVVPDGQTQRPLTLESRDTLTKHKGKGQSSSKDVVVPDGQAQSTITSENLSPVSDNATPDILNDAVVPTTELSVPSKETEDCTYPKNYLLPVHLEKSQARSYVEDTEQPVTDNPIEEKQPEIKAANEPLPVLSKGSVKEISIPRGKKIVSSLPVLSETTPGIYNECHLETETKSPETTSTTEVVRNPGIIGKLKKLFGVQRDVDEIKVVMTKERFWDETVKAGKKKLHHRKIAPVIIWDFGGQDVFYSTHQTFLTYRAIYLLVLDGSRNLDDPCVFEQYLPGKSGPKTARDYLRFWINTIVTYCKGSGPGFPKIMIVLTHKDKLRAMEVEPRRQQLFHAIEKMFSGSPLLSHLVIKDQFFVNARDKSDPEMAKIKKNIIEQAIEQPTWGQELPKCFIPLELEFDSLLNRNIPLITMDHMMKINSAQPVRPLTDEELKVFLKFQHSVGRILYFDESSLDQHIILSPTHLIDAFKSIVTDRRFCEGDTLRQVSWELMSQKGVIAKKSVADIWQKKKYKSFQKHKDYLLGVMTHLDILVEPRRYDKTHKRIPAEFYYVASMVRTNDTTGYLKSTNFVQRNIAIAFSSSSSMIPPALSFRFISYCLSIFAVKTNGQQNDEMLFHRSAVFNIDPSLDMCVNCDDEMIVVRLVHLTNRKLIMRDLASCIRECLAIALEKISQLYVKTSSTGSVINEGSFNLSLCCSSPENPCLLLMSEHQKQDGSWICPEHRIEHTNEILSSWALQKAEITCGVACPVTDNEFLKQTPKDIHLRRLSMEYSIHETKELSIHLGMKYNIWESLYDTLGEEADRLNFEILHRCIDSSAITFDDIRKAAAIGDIQNPHTLCKVVRDKLIDFDQEPEIWDYEPSEEHFDRLAPFVGNNSLPFLIELGMEFKTWEQIRFRQKERDLVKLNRDIMQEWKSTFCNLHAIRPSLRHIGQAFNNIGKNIKIIENVLADFS
ncbi:uncharacterized protein LOC143083986 isoform X1 [Mytilus galloprovincialis]|uniref:uncharacterized protein LOC143083986 isoform X1 n=1 Tax=Mytilus galloprovincialis TaxID=29158 RepID=UPI003F7B6B10